MKPERKNGKAQIYKDHIGDCVVLVTSRDPQTKIQILKEQKKSTRPKRQSERGFGLFSMLDKI